MDVDKLFKILDDEIVASVKLCWKEENGTTPMSKDFFTSQKINLWEALLCRLAMRASVGVKNARITG